MTSDLLLAPASDGSAAPAAPGVDDQARRQIARISWLHLANDLSLDFITPLLPVGIGVAWIGVMEGAADASSQILKLWSGRASDRAGRRAAWVGSGYVINALARPPIAIALAVGQPWIIVGCRILDRVGKGVRGSATDALVTDWSSGEDRARAFARTITMDHLGATAGGLAAALAAALLTPHHLWLAVAGLVPVTAWVAILAGGLRDRPVLASAPPAAPAGAWWPREARLRAPLAAITLAALGTRISPLLIVAVVAGLGRADRQAVWPLWVFCLGWSAFGLVQAASSASAGWLTARLGPGGMLRIGWLAAAAVYAGLAWGHGIGAVLAGAGFGIIIGCTDGAEKTWIAQRAPRGERATAFGALALATAVGGLIGNSLCSILLATWGPQVFLILAAVLLIAAVLASLAARSELQPSSPA
jgi:MFS family permease